MHKPKAPTPDPAIAAAQAAEQRRAETGQISQTQAGLSSDTVALRRRFGVMASALAAPTSGASGGGGTGQTYPGGLPPGFDFSSINYGGIF